MNAVLNSYGQLCGCPEILKKVVNFFVVGLTYGCRKSCMRISGTPAAFAPLSISWWRKLLLIWNILSVGRYPYKLSIYISISSARKSGMIIVRLLFCVLGVPMWSFPSNFWNVLLMRTVCFAKSKSSLVRASSSPSLIPHQ